MTWICIFIQSCHSAVFVSYQTLMKDPEHKFKNTKQAKLPYERTVVSSKEFQAEKLVTDYIIYSIKPLSTVDCPWFKALVAGNFGFNLAKPQWIHMIYYCVSIGLSDGVKCPSRTKLDDIIRGRYLRRVMSIKETISQAAYYCATTDIWSSRRKSYIGMTLHWIRKDNLERQSAVLAVKRFRGTHDFQRISEMILEIFAQFDIHVDKVTCVTTDNATNFVKSFKEYGVVFELVIPEDVSNLDEDDDDGELVAVSEIVISDPLLPPHQRCASHTLSLCATTDLDKVNTIFGLIKIRCPIEPFITYRQILSLREDKLTSRKLSEAQWPNVLLFGISVQGLTKLVKISWIFVAESNWFDPLWRGGILYLTQFEDF